MKLAKIKGVSATVASLALVGTCFAAPAMAEEAASVFASSDAPAEQAEVVVTEEAAATPTLDAGTQAALSEVLSALGFDQETIDAVVGADYSQLLAEVDSDQVVDAVSQAAQQVADEYGIDAESLDVSADELAQVVTDGLAELGIDESTIDAAATELADAVSSAVGDFVGTVGSYLYDQGYLNSEYTLFSGDSTLSSDPDSLTVEYAGLNFLLPADFTGVAMTADDIAQAVGTDESGVSVGDLVEDGFIAISSDDSAAVFAAEIKADQLEGFDVAQFASVAYSLPYFYASEDDATLAFGGARLDDGTPVLAGGAQTDEGIYQLVFAPSDSGSIVVVVFFGDQSATMGDYDQLREIGLSLTGTGAVETSGTMVIDGDATAEEVVDAAVAAATGEAQADTAAEAAPAEEAK